MFWFLAYLYLMLVYYTSKIRLDSDYEETILYFRSQRPLIFLFWFEHIILLMCFFYNQKITLFMTPKGKSDFFTKLGSLVKVRIAKGSLEGGGRHALLNLLEIVKEGKMIAMAADGPRGPEHKCKVGSFIISSETGCPIVPMSWSSSRTFKLTINKSKVLIPKPFSSIQIKLGKLNYTPKGGSIVEFEPLRVSLEEQLGGSTSPNG